MIFNFAPILFFNRQNQPYHKKRLLKMFHDYGVSNFTEIKIPTNKLKYKKSKITVSPDLVRQIKHEDYHNTISHLICLQHFVKPCY